MYVALGWVAVALGAVGVLLPGLPTTIFMILAAYFFSKGSPRAREWLLERTRFGPAIKTWEADGAIERPTKRLAIGVMGLVLAASIFFGAPSWVIIVQLACMGPVAVFIWTRPEPRGQN